MDLRKHGVDGCRHAPKHARGANGVYERTYEQSLASRGAKRETHLELYLVGYRLKNLRSTSTRVMSELCRNTARRFPLVLDAGRHELERSSTGHVVDSKVRPAYAGGVDPRQRLEP